MVGKVSVKDHVVNILGFVGQMMSVVAIQLCHCRVKVAKEIYI